MFVVAYLSKMIINVLISILSVEVSRTREGLERQRIQLMKIKKALAAQEKKRKESLKSKGKNRFSLFPPN